jgi:hypothetical protein
VTIPGVESELINIWFITNPESALKPVIFPDVRLAVQLNVAPGTLDVKGMFVDSPEQMVFESGLFVTDGTGVVIN